MLRITIVLAGALIFSGCGGSSTSNVQSSQSNRTISGVVSDGPIKNAKIGLDLNFSDSLEPSEVLTTSNGLGQFSFVLDQSSSAFPLIAVSGIDTLLNKPFEGTLLAPLPSSTTTTQMISPLTTLLAKGASESSVRQLFNLSDSIDINKADPGSNIDLLKACARLHVLSTHLSKATSNTITRAYEKLASLQSLNLGTIKSAVESLSGTISRGIEKIIHENFNSYANVNSTTGLIQLQSISLGSVSSAITRLSSSTVVVTTGLNDLLMKINNRVPSIENTIGLTMTYIQSGTFKMWESPGGVPRSQGPYSGTTTTLTKGFYLGIVEVTQSQWQQVVGTGVWPGGFLAGSRNGDDYPIYDVTWHDAYVFINKLNDLEGTDAYRLPTEAEWEYSARAGTTTSYYFGEDPALLDNYEWFKENSNEELHPVAMKQPNPWGLYDMYGNVSEWTNTWFTYTFNLEPQIDPIGPPFSGGSKIHKGHFYTSSRDALGHEYRLTHDPSTRLQTLGFRVLREIR